MKTEIANRHFDLEREKGDFGISNRLFWEILKKTCIYIFDSLPT